MLVLMEALHSLAWVPHKELQSLLPVSIASLYPASTRAPSETVQTPEGFSPAHRLVSASSDRPKTESHCEPGAGRGPGGPGGHLEKAPGALAE